MSVCENITVLYTVSKAEAADWQSMKIVPTDAFGKLRPLPECAAQCNSDMSRLGALVFFALSLAAQVADLLPDQETTRRTFQMIYGPGDNAAQLGSGPGQHQSAADSFSLVFSRAPASNDWLCTTYYYEKSAEHRAVFKAGTHGHNGDINQDAAAQILQVLQRTRIESDFVLQIKQWRSLNFSFGAYDVSEADVALLPAEGTQVLRGIAAQFTDSLPRAKLRTVEV